MGSTAVVHRRQRYFSPEGRGDDARTGMEASGCQKDKWTEWRAASDSANWYLQELSLLCNVCAVTPAHVLSNPGIYIRNFLKELVVKARL